MNVTRKNWLALLGAAALLMGCLTLAACGGQEEPVPQEAEESQVVEEIDYLGDGLVIATPVGDLIYPEKWNDVSRMEEVPNEGGYGAAVYGTAGEREVKLFTIYVGGEVTEGHLFGTAPDQKGDPVEVRIAVDGFEPDDTWEEAAADEIYTMQEGVNFIIEQVMALPGYVRAG